MRRLALLLLCLLLPAVASAQDLPALYAVTGVAADDVLNLRDAPRASGQKIGTLAPDATGVEVTAIRDGWGRVNAGPRAGWASMRYLAREAPDAEVLTRRLSCAGTEPFWSLDITQGARVRFEPADGPAQEAAAGTLRPAEGWRDAFVLPLEAGEGGLSAVILHRRQCSDGMSDRAFGLSVDLLTGAAPDPLLRTGCCSLR
ncbi:SH3 domain-containing protein [Aquicoccus sp. SCR17]|nr:SH3 domain-containing protein [Carideicomes alvinocaridis]